MNITKRLGEGVNFHYLPADRFTTDYFCVNFILPLREDTASAYSLLTKLFKRGCRAYPTQGALGKRLEELYSTSLSISVSKSGDRQMLSFGMDMLASRFLPEGVSITEEACALLRDVLTDPYLEDGAFPAFAVEREKTALKAQLRAAINDKRKHAMNRCREIMCEGEAYRVPLEGSEASITAATPASLYAAYLRMLREATIEIFYSGIDTYDTAESYARDLVARLGERHPVTRSTVFKERAERVKEVTEEIEAAQGKLAIGFRTGLSSAPTRKEEDALVLFNLIYGTSPVSKLFMNVRERLSLCYYCASRCDGAKGVLFVQSGIENDKKEIAVQEILRQLNEIRAGNVTKEEMLCAKQGFRDLSRSISDSPFTLCDWYLKRTLMGDDRTPEEMCADIEALTLEDVVAAAKRISLDTVYFLKGTGGESEADE